MAKILNNGLKIVACYLAASISYLLYFNWPHYEGHADVPFSSFPEFLVWTPVAPYILFQELSENPHIAFLGLFVFCASFMGTLWLFFLNKRNA